MTRWITAAGSAALMACLCAGGARAQAGDSARAELTRWIFPGSDAENYLRYLQTLGIVAAYPWSARAFSNDELRRLRPRSNEHPWAGTRTLRDDSQPYKGTRVTFAPVELHGWYNTSFPFGMNDGAVWVGRGLTGSVSAGVSAHLGPVELTLAPTAFWAENRSFELVATGVPSELADPYGPLFIDRPQRFGNAAYGGIDPGQSTLRLDVIGLGLGISTANAWWGPMSEFPYILGNNAAGFPHVFFGSSRPVNVFVGRLHGRVIYASLEQSDFSPVTTGNRRRFAAGAVATFLPRGFPGLELGLTRFFHVVWPDSGLTSAYFTHLFETFLKTGIGDVFAPAPNTPAGTSSDNQLASLTARWVLPRSGFEVYGEYGREDHNTDARDLIVQPDHAATYGVGARKAWRDGAAITAVRAEIMNFQMPTLVRYRGEGGIYIHTLTPQGHTHRGQVLGAGIGVRSAAASNVTVERFDSRGLSRATWLRVVQDAGPNLVRADVQNVLRVERRSFRREKSVELRWAADAVYELNRGARNDQFNLRSELAALWYP